MRVTGSEKLEDCFDGSMVFRWRFEKPWDRESIAALSRLGSLDYFPEFPRPYFRLRTSEGFQMSGVEGESACRVVLPPGRNPSAILPGISGLRADTTL
jgi:hypothetical protein